MFEETMTKIISTLDTVDKQNILVKAIETKLNKTLLYYNDRLNNIDISNTTINTINEYLGGTKKCKK